MGRSSNCLRRMVYCARRFVAIHGGADDAPADAVARLRKARQRTFQPLGARQPAISFTRQSANARLEVTEARMDHLP
jgi:hypothetical protein